MRSSIILFTTVLSLILTLTLVLIRVLILILNLNLDWTVLLGLPRQAHLSGLGTSRQSW